MRRTLLCLALILGPACLACRGDFAGGGDGTGQDSSGTSGGSSTGDGSDDTSGSGSGAGGTGDTSSDGSDTGSSSDSCGGADFDNDPDNCGYCGHSCLGGDCVEGVCQPVVLVEDWARGIAIGSDRVFWHNNTAEAILIFSVSVDGGQPTTVTESLTGSGTFSGLHVDSTFVYTTHGSSTEAKVLKAPINGGPLSPVGGGTDPRTIMAVAFDETHAYWADTGAAPVTLRKVPLSGGPGTPLVPDMSAIPRALAVDATAIYWVTEETASGAGDGTVMRLAKQGGMPAALVQEEIYDPQDVASDDDSVYWNDFDSGKILKVPVDGGGVTDLAFGQLPYTIALDDVALYWADANGKIGSVPKDGGTATALVEDLVPPPRMIAVDDAAVYWANLGNPDPAAVIMKLAKP